jgi:hypothetical protein
MKKITLLIGLIVMFSCRQKDHTESKLGVVDFQVYGNALAQPHFEKGLLLLHSFEYEDSREEFLKAQVADPNMAMAYWGEAMTYNHSIWSDQDYESGFEVVQKINNLKELDQLSEVELELIEAIKILYKPKTPKVERDNAFMNYLKQLYEKQPNNNELAAFYSISLL